MKSLLEEQNCSDCPEFADIEIVINKIRLQVSYQIIFIKFTILSLLSFFFF